MSKKPTLSHLIEANRVCLLYREYVEHTAKMEKPEKWLVLNVQFCVTTVTFYVAFENTLTLLAMVIILLMIELVFILRVPAEPLVKLDLPDHR